MLYVPGCMCVLIYIITSAIAAPLPAVCISIYIHRTLVVMVVLVQMSRMMCVECVEGTGAHAL